MEKLQVEMYSLNTHMLIEDTGQGPQMQGQAGAELNCSSICSVHWS